MVDPAGALSGDVRPRGPRSGRQVAISSKHTYTPLQLDTTKRLHSSSSRAGISKQPCHPPTPNRGRGNPSCSSVGPAPPLARLLRSLDQRTPLLILYSGNCYRSRRGDRPDRGDSIFSWVSGWAQMVLFTGESLIKWHPVQSM